MVAEIIPFRRAVCTPFGHVIRSGESAYRKLEHLHAQGRLPAQAVIVDASVAGRQGDFIRSLRENGAEVTLDTKAAELSTLGKCGGLARKAPWAMADGRPLERSDFERGANAALFAGIAEMAVGLGVSSVFAPSHYLRYGRDDAWLAIDRCSVVALREALDRAGGHGIGIDYPLMLPHTALPGAEDGVGTFGELRGLPIDNLLLRLSGFGVDAGPLVVRRAFQGIVRLHALGYPVLLDHVGGLVGTAALAFRIVGGIAHGIGERERFDARDWHKPPKARTGEEFRRAVLLPVSDLDRSFRRKEFDVIVAARGGRRLVACGDRARCPQGLTSMLADPRAHLAWQRFRALGELAKVPDERRMDHFLDVEVRKAERKARDLARVRTGNAAIDRTLATRRGRMDSMTRVYEKLAVEERPAPLPPAWRGAREVNEGETVA